MSAFDPNEVVVNSDITDKKKVKDALQKSKEELEKKVKSGVSKLKIRESMYKILYHSSRDAIMTLEPPKWKFTSGNTAAVKLFGCKDETQFISIGPWQVSPKSQPDGQAYYLGINEGEFSVLAKNIIEDNVENNEFYATIPFASCTILSGLNVFSVSTYTTLDSGSDFIISTGQVPNEEQGNDQDDDSLPDYWEKLFDSVSCELDFRVKDSNGDGIFDSDEDYDNDGYTNYEEYRAGYDPCLADAPAREEQDPTEVEYDDTFATGITTEKESNVGAWITFILGIFLSIGGGGFLTYFYLYMPVGKRIVDGARRTLGVKGGPISTKQPGFVKPFKGRAVSQAQTRAPAQSLFSGLKNKLSKLKEERALRRKSLHRKEIFSEFSTGSKEFTHFKDIMHSQKPHKERLGDLMQRYNDHHEQVRSGLQPHEKGLFDKLDALSHKAKGKSVPASSKEAKDIFDKLKKLSSQRKK